MKTTARFLPVLILALSLAFLSGCKEEPRGDYGPINAYDFSMQHRNDAAKIAAEKERVFKVDVSPNSRYMPDLAVMLPDSCPTPAGMALDTQSGRIFVNVPNVAPLDPQGKPEYPALLCSFSNRHDLRIELEYPAGSVPMGLTFGPDGNLYAADACGEAGQAGALRVEMKDGKATGSVTKLVSGLHHPTALVWQDGSLYVTDSEIPEANAEKAPSAIGYGGVWRFAADELQTGTLAATPEKHLWATCPVYEIGRKDNHGLGGIVSAWGALYAGNYGDGLVFRLTPGEGAKANVEKVVDNPLTHCSAGMFYDPASDLIYVCDSQANAVRTLDKDLKVEWIWLNGDTTGDDGSLDQPLDCVVRGDVLFVSNFDVPEKGFKNQLGPDKAYSISRISLAMPEEPVKEPPAEPKIELPELPAETVPEGN